ncbi:MAG: TIGR03617 family F420-dependent LLM class oxidoreductase [Anaerolineales bacterium]|nr:MAG: TIGR03617 family F420-dependent LLM class oxidoreductase [Anaerolineales bacterium]
MKIDTSLPPLDLEQVPDFTRAAEAIGFDAIWTTETQHNPFLPLTLIAEHSDKIALGTAVAIAFARSPATVAYTAWNLAKLSRGRFILGLGTQVKAHIERRFSMPWPESPVARLRDFVGALRALWGAWQTGGNLNYRGEHYKLTLMTPFFNPGPIDHPDIPIYLAGVNTGLCRLAGEIAQGFHVHPLHSVDYLEQVIRPALTEGAGRTGRSLDDIECTASAFIVTDLNEEIMARGQIAFYASTPSYRAVFKLHGWDKLAEELSQMARRGEWIEMAGKINDDVLETFAVVAGPEDLGSALVARYDGLVQRVIPYSPYQPGLNETFWKSLIRGVKRN